MAEHVLTIVEALENLNAIVDATSIDELELTEDERLVWHDLHADLEKADYFVSAGLNEQTLKAVKLTFKVVRDHLNTFYRKMKVEGDKKRLLEGINAVMVLVGEASKKLEHYSALFKKQIHQMPEYRDLQEFYRTKVVKQSFKALGQGEAANLTMVDDAVIADRGGTHLLNDLNVIRDDRLYELFYLKNEMGYDFFTSQLARDIKLACDFGEYANEYSGDDPLLQVKNWEDRSRYLMAKELLAKIKHPLEQYMKEAMQYRDVPIVSLVNMAMMALLLSTNSRNLIRQFALKGCSQYFQDFTLFVREILCHREFQVLMLYPKSDASPIYGAITQLMSAVVAALFSAQPNREEVIDFLTHNMKTKASAPFSQTLIDLYTHLHEQIRVHPSGPVLKAVDLIRNEEEAHLFDPFLLNNLPEIEGSVFSDHRQIDLMRLPSPTTQQSIQKATVTEEFINFLRGCQGHFVLVNLQDRTSWKEYARCEAIESLSQMAEFVDKFSVITLPTQTEFYHQAGAYEHLGEAPEFIAQLGEHLKDEGTGFFISKRVSEALTPTWIEGLLKGVHESYFHKKAVLNLNERRAFISLVYHYLVLKVVELTEATSLAMCSKDGFDIAGAFEAGLITLINPAVDQREKVAGLLFGPTLIGRERLIHKDHFDRLVGMCKKIEEVPQPKLGKLFKSKEHQVVMA